MDIDCVHVLGAGVMGRGLAHCLGRAGLKTVLIDRDQAILRDARQAIERDLRLAHMMPRHEAALDPAETLAQIEVTTDLQTLAGADLVIESVSEDRQVKQQLYTQIDAICPESCVFASNTSCIPITLIGSWTGRPDRVIGTHFMNPPQMKDTVEVVRGAHTSDETLAITTALLERLGNRAMVVNDGPGFATNRVLMLTINEAAFVLQDRVADARQVDDLFKRCFGHQMGPLETADLIGLDTVLASIKVLRECFKNEDEDESGSGSGSGNGNEKDRPCPLLEKMVAAGRLGRKSGQGFHTYAYPT